uniref:Uncharacterized protein n=1 Tax=Panagrolaimus sp. ES5 TaxID=591445 RepID=A0AC34F4Q2_9BILA
MLQANNLTSLQKVLTDVGTLLLGAQPYRQVKVKEALFLGYTDPLIDLINSPLVKLIEEVTGQSIFGFKTPDIQVLGFFPNYNHTGDESYVVNSGNSDYKKVAYIEEWANSTSLAWWLSDAANDITGASDGSYWGGFLEKDKKLKNFQSFLCRHMEMEYIRDEDIDGISGYLYKFTNGVFNTSVPGNEGYIIKDPLDKIYFPHWAHSHPLDSDAHHTFPAAHPEVIDSMIGLSPSEDLHNMGEFIIQPKVGSTLKASLRMQFNVAVFNDPHFVVLQNLRSTIVPAFWLDVEINLKDYALNYIKQNTTTIPLIFLIVGIILVVLSLLIAFTIAGSMFARKQRKRNYLSDD